MKILITGGSGFVGSNIAIYLKKNLKGVKIYSLDNLSRKGSIINKPIWDHQLRLVEDDRSCPQPVGPKSQF